MNSSDTLNRPRLIYWVHIALLIPELAMFTWTFVTLMLNPFTTGEASPFEQGVILIVGLVISPLTVAVGLLCIRRAPGNVVGVMLAIWGCSIIEIIALPETPWISSLGTVLAGVIWPATFFLFAYFPDGRAYPPRFEKLLDRIVLVTYLAGLLAGLASEKAISRDVPNIFYVAALEPMNRLLTAIHLAGAISAMIGFGAISLGLRFRRADQETRQRIKWLLFGFVPMPFGVLLLIIAPLVPSVKAVSDYGGNFFQLWLMLFPVVAIGNAILRHKLYDIDIIIRRTLIYSMLTTILAVIYFGGVILVQQVFKSVTGQTSDLAIVISTLLIAALFSPIRRRVQDVIDRRLYRRKYDAEKTLTQFQQNLRDEVDMETLKANLITVVGETMQPDKIALWVRKSIKDKSR